jgi:hypothetical protein
LTGGDVSTVVVAQRIRTTVRVKNRRDKFEVTLSIATSVYRPVVRIEGLSTRADTLVDAGSCREP